MNSPLRVLFVEDNEGDALLLRHTLEEDGFEVFSERVETAESLCDVLHRETWHLILSDYSMPQFNGLEALQICRENGCDAPFILISGAIGEEIAVEMLKKGASDYIVKDNLPRLVPAVRRELKDAEERRKRKQAEQMLCQSEEMFRALSVCSPVGVYMADRQGCRVYVNPRLREITGLTLMQSVGEGWINSVHPGDRDAVLAAWKAYLAVGGEYHMEYRVQRSDGSVRWVHSRATPRRSEKDEVLEHVGTVEDITERKQAEQALQESEQRFRKLIEDSPEAIFVEDDCGTVLEANPAACRLHGLSREQLVGKNVLDLVPPEDRAEVAAEFPKWLTGELSQCERFSYTADNRSIPVELRGRCIEYQGRPAVLLYVRDVSERKQLEQQLRQSQKMDALGQMASGVAHDINNSLACILGFSDLLLTHPEKLNDKEKVTEFLHLINVAAHDAGDVVSRLRQFYRKREGGTTLCPVDLNQIVRDAVALSEPRWRTQARAKGVTITVLTELGEVPTSKGDPAELREALMNLIFNAVDALAADGAITLRTRGEKGLAVIEVADTGVGMTEEVRQRCLEPFFTTKGDHGTGLGLAMVYGVMQRHHGTIDIQSAPGKGTTFTLCLPLELAAEKTISSVVPVVQRRNLRVLAVEDDPMLQAVLVAYLTEDGHFVVTADDGVDGLEKFTGGQFDVVITDQVMPRMNGLEMAAAIRELAPRQPIIVVSGYGEEVAHDGRPPPADLLLSKPVTISALRTGVAKVIKRKGRTCFAS